MDNVNRLAKKGAKNIQRLRRERKLRQVDLASLINLSPRHLQKIESGEIDISVRTIENLAQSLDVPACYIINDVGSGRLEPVGILCPCSILEMLPVGLCVITVEGSVLFSNPALNEILKVKEFAKHQKPLLWDLIADKSDLPLVKNFFEKSQQGSGNQTLYTKVKDSLGATIPVKFDTKLVRDRAEKPSGHIIVVTSHPSW